MDNANVDAMIAKLLGWTSSVLGYNSPLRLFRGKYDVTVTMAPEFVEAFGLAHDYWARFAERVVEPGRGAQQPLGWCGGPGRERGRERRLG